jgi:hypothetical protein
MKLIHTNSVLQYRQKIVSYTRQGYEVVQETSAGTQLKRKRRIRLLTTIFLVTGIMTFVFAGFGIILLILALINHLLTPAGSVFVECPPTAILNAPVS